jgi:hypothetical protein
MESDNGILCRIGRVVEADINLRGGSGDGAGPRAGQGGHCAAFKLACQSPQESDLILFVPVVGTENVIRVDDVMESPELAE